MPEKNSREEILNRIMKPSVKKEISRLPETRNSSANPVERFKEVLTSIGGSIIPVRSESGIQEYLYHHFETHHRIISVLPKTENKGVSGSNTLHHLDNVEVTVVKGHFGVAENGSVWITDSQLSDRVLPFICQHLMVIINMDEIVATMHEAYDRIGLMDYDFGTFIAGPSRTADIEQSLVLGAHGPRSMTVFLLENDAK